MEAKLCSYSRTLQARDLCTRKAKVGDELSLVKVGRWIRGFAHWDVKQQKAVLTCLRPGTEIVFERRFLIEGSRSFVECDNGERIMVTDIIPTKEATIAGLPNGYRDGRTAVDGVKWPTGLGMGLSCLPIGINIRVLQLPPTKQRKRAKAVEVERIERSKVRRRQRVAGPGCASG
jgi:hypothetical protein